MDGLSIAGITSISSGSAIYQVTLNNCTCPDFYKRGEKCKHMYRLQMELDAEDGKEYMLNCNLDEIDDEEMKQAILDYRKAHADIEAVAEQEKKNGCARWFYLALAVATLVMGITFSGIVSIAMFILFAVSLIAAIATYFK